MTNFSFSSTRYALCASSFRKGVVSSRLTSRAISRSASRRAGFTVLEVLIAMVVLLIGGLAIMNLFPPAFNVIHGSENREIAMSQVKGTLARYNSDPASIPDAIFDRAPGGGWNDPDIAVEGSRNRNFSLPKTDADYDSSALGHFKHIVGERHKVLQDNSGNKFVLLNYAYTNTPQVSVPDLIEGVRVSSTGMLDFTDAIKASDGSAFTTPTAGFYYVSYSFQTPLTVGPPPTYALQSVDDEPIAFVASPGNMQVFQGAQGKKVVDGPIALKIFTTKSASPPSPIDADDLARGFLAVDASFVTGQEVAVDYDVLDWRWLVEDISSTVPTIKSNPPLAGPAPATARDVKLTIPFLGTPVTTAPSGKALYALTMPAPDAQGVLPKDERRGLWTAAPGAVGNDVVLDVDQTSATYDIADSIGTNKPPMVAPRVRTSYWATHGWAQQLSVAAKSYYAFDTNRATTEKWREFYWQPLSDSTGTVTSSNIMYFHASEAGKTIMVSFLSGTNKVTNQIMTIGAKLLPRPNLPNMPNFESNNQVSAVNFIDASGNPVAADAIQSVRGVSVRSRSAWIQNGEYTQEVAEMYRPLN